MTLEDILEELVGEIWDEHDVVVNEIEKISDSEYLVMGNAQVDKLFETLHREGEFEVITVSGWVMDRMGRIPKEGDRFTFDDLDVTVLKMKEKRVYQVKVKDLHVPA